MKSTKMLLAAFFLLFFGFSQTVLAQKDAAVFYPAIRNEKLTIKALEQISLAQATYFSINGNKNYGTLLQLAQAGYIDDVLATGSKYSYYFTVTVQNHTPTTPSRYTVVAVPQFYRRTGNRSFYMNENGLVRGGDKQGAAANQNDPLIEEYFVCNSIEECEANAISSLRILHSAEVTYQATYGNGNYGSLCQLGGVSLVDELLASGSKFGYYFIVFHRERTQNSPATLKVIAIPRQYGQTGRRSFFIDETGVVRAADRNGAPANADDPPVN